jgi:parallel beta-helix repeat protein
MPRAPFLLLVLSFFFAATLHAQSNAADLSVEFEFPAEEQLTASSFGTWVRIRNLGPDTARGLTITADAPGVKAITFFRTSTQCAATTCTTTAGDLAPDSYIEFGVAFELPREIETTIPLTVRVSSSTPDPNTANNVVEQDEVFVALPQLYAQVSTHNNQLEPEQPTHVFFRVVNIGRTASEGTALELTLPAGAAVLGVAPPPGVTCSFDTSSVRCNAGRLEANSGIDNIDVTARTPAAYDGGSFEISVVATATNRTRATHLSTSTTSWFFLPLFVVNNTADTGPGSLRQAMIDANARCATTQCRIGFRIPESLFSGAAATIRPATPLPAVTGMITIDGASEKTFTGNDAVAHPLVQLDGSLLANGNGFDLRADGSSISGLAIGNFPGIGVLLAPQPQQSFLRSIRDCFVGTDATGSVAMPNDRGVMILSVRYGTVERNVISGNRRSGLWLLGSYQFHVSSNRIGVAADAETPLPNGASGIYVGPLTERPWILNNTIAYNAEFGIAIHPSVREIDASENSIFGNGRFGIDYGLDLATPNSLIDIGRAPNTPILVSARYDAAKNVTRITGELHSFADTTLGNRFRVILYANDSANAQAQRRLGYAQTGASQQFTFDVPGDLRGKYITGITLRYRKGDEGTLEEYSITEETSEISAAVQVE